MATRSGETGIVATLVLFVIATVGLLVATVLLFNAKGAAERERDETRNDLRSSEQKLDGLEKVSREAASILGTNTLDPSEIRMALGLNANDRATQVVTTLRRSIKDAEARLKALQQEVDQTRLSAETERAAFADARAEFDRGLESIRQELSGFQDLASAFGAQVDELRDDFARSTNNLREEHRSRRDLLEARLKDAEEESETLTVQVERLNKIVRGARARAQDAATLVDARIVDITPDGTMLFVDLGRRDRLRPGMTFEVYSDPSLITSTNRMTGEATPMVGKATVEILRVGDTTSQARVTRLAPRGQIQRSDVLANPIYSPDHQYRFLVHGLFDVDGDGLPSQPESDFVRQRIVDWNGAVAESGTMSGDVDFVVVGLRPIRRPAPSIDASDAEMAAYAKAEEQLDQYDTLLRAAAEAQIPVLNWNRLQVLTGSAQR
ncbi:MAG: hypothetical protein O2819_03700 [Planctomycetota bacterium]|nr:hypothetical protein [Planctomycetota bacterium]